MPGHFPEFFWNVGIWTHIVATANDECQNLKALKNPFRPPPQK